MGLERLNWLIPFVTLLSAGCLGGLLALLVWIQFAAERAPAAGKRIPKSLVAFTASPCIEFAALAILFFLGETAHSSDAIFGLEPMQLVIAAGLLAGIVLLMAAHRLARGDPGGITAIVRRSSIVLLAIDAMGVVLFAFALYMT